MRDVQSKAMFGFRPGPLVNRMAGGSFSEATLGPLSFVERANDANANRGRRGGPQGRLPAAMDSAEQAYPDAAFKSGHLINSSLGGPGTDARNLTILSGSGNTAMNGPDNAIKAAVGKLEKIYRLFHKAGLPADGMDAAIHLKVTVSPAKWGRDPPDCHICNFVTYAARLTGNFDHALPPSDAAERDRLKAEITALLRAAKGRVDNRKPRR
ncbi:MAG: hypothetical protein KGN34_06610 [Sphingomonadales bacterium]|nr:hypothetical protein [Sphingomonadales bacterium]